MAASILSFCESLEQTSLGVMVRESIWGFPILVLVHIMGLVFSVGVLVWFDFRLLGVGLQNARVSVVYRRLIPWATVGFVSMFTTGGILLTGFATNAYRNGYFWTKMATLALAATNALFYHLVTERGIGEWDGAPQPPRAARLAGLVSIVLWAVVILCGRMMSYTMFNAP